MTISFNKNYMRTLARDIDDVIELASLHQTSSFDKNGGFEFQY
ncbi:MAG TPA: hypothetical protein PLW14_05965 [Chlorobiota bacterium]|nr:hypothetical protein [Chlorobiota bacterium]